VVAKIGTVSILFGSEWGMDIQTYILLPSSEACQVFIRDNEDMDDYMNADGSVDKWCIKTEKLSASIRPKLRPEEL